MYEALSDLRVTRPSYVLLNRAYEDYRREHDPCKDGTVRNQCAVRLSVALARCGLDLGGFRPPNRLHRGLVTHHLGTH